MDHTTEPPALPVVKGRILIGEEGTLYVGMGVQEDPHEAVGQGLRLHQAGKLACHTVCGVRRAVGPVAIV